MIARDEWLTALREAGVPTESDDEAVTAAEFSKMMAMPRTTAIERLERLVRAGKATKTFKRCRRSDGDTIMAPAYRLVQAQQKKR
jgi:hypothetical protein